MPDHHHHNRWFDTASKDSQVRLFKKQKKKKKILQIFQCFSALKSNKDSEKQNYTIGCPGRWSIVWKLWCLSHQYDKSTCTPHGKALNGWNCYGVTSQSHMHAHTVDTIHVWRWRGVTPYGSGMPRKLLASRAAPIAISTHYTMKVS